MMIILKRVSVIVLMMAVLLSLTGGITDVLTASAQVVEDDGTISIDCSHLQPDRSNEMTNSNPDGFSWHSSNDKGMVIALPLEEYNMVMLRAMEVGDWMSFPFEMEESGLYMFCVKLGAFDSYAGQWQVYLNGEPIGEPYSAKSQSNRMIVVPMEFTYLEKGTHTIKVELIGDPNTANLEWGSLISMGQVVLKKPSVSLHRDNSTEEYYTDANTHGVTIRYGAALRDVILLGRGNGTISGDGLTADAQQVIVKGLYDGGVHEAFSVENGTSVKCGDMTLLDSDGPIDMDVDYHLANVPIRDQDDVGELILDSNFNIDKPTVIVNTAAAADRKVSFLVGNHAPYAVSVDGQAVESTCVDGLLSMTVPAGEHRIEIVGTHYCTFECHTVKPEHLKDEATCVMPSVYYVSCYCGENGSETFTFGNVTDHRPYVVRGKEATEEEDGYITHFACKSCDKVFADAQCKQELNPADVFLTHTVPVNYTLLIVVVAVGGVALIVAVLIGIRFGFFKKKSTK